MNYSTEENGIREAINYYVEGNAQRQCRNFKKGFHEQAILFDYLGDELIAAPIVGYYDWVSPNPSPSETGDHFTCEVLSVEITGRVASTKVREIGHGEVVIDYFHSLKESDKWTVVSKLWDAES